MYESYTYEYLLNRMLDRVSNDIDKREGSIIHDALAPAAAELAQMYAELEVNNNLSYADTATGNYLSRRTAELGVERNPATKAQRQGLFYGSNEALMDVPLESRFSIGSLIYAVTEKISTGIFQMKCETAGTAGNEQFGTMLPIEYIDGLVRAELADVLVPGEDEESDDDLRERYFDGLENQAFGGNIADYKEKTNSLDGVGGTKVFPVWNGGGTVKLVIIDSTYNKPSPTLVDTVQTAIDPVQNQGQGLGLAPIDHIVTVEGVTETTVDIETSLTFEEGYTWVDVQPNFEAAINEYFAELNKTWEDSSNLVVRISQIETRALNVTGILDIQNTKINTLAQNLVLSDVAIPVLGTVTNV